MAASREARRCGGKETGSEQGEGRQRGQGGMRCKATPEPSAHGSVLAAAPARNAWAHNVCTCVLRRVPRSGGPKGGKAALSVLRSFIRRSSEPQGGMERPRRRWVRAAAGGERRGGSEAPAAFEAEAKTPGVGGGRLTSWGRAR